MVYYFLRRRPWSELHLCSMQACGFMCCCQHCPGDDSSASQKRETAAVRSNSQAIPTDTVRLRKESSGSLTEHPTRVSAAALLVLAAPGAGGKNTPCLPLAAVVCLVPTGIRVPAV